MRVGHSIVPMSIMERHLQSADLLLQSIVMTGEHEIEGIIDFVGS